MYLPPDTFIDVKLINELAKNYSPLDYTVKMIRELTNAIPLEDFDCFSKYDLHKYVNDLLLKYYAGEQVYKYKLCKSYFHKKSVVGAFEIKVNNSRADFLTINGHTNCYEIKTGLDNFSKFKKQAADYMLAFEYNNLIVDECHYAKALEVLPESFGLWISKNGRHKQVKKAVLNSNLDAEVQLNLLTKEELNKSYLIDIADRNQILKSYSGSEINTRFKKTLKERYRDRWEFVVKNKQDIFPIDFQFFFNRNISPQYIYQ